MTQPQTRRMSDFAMTRSADGREQDSRIVDDRPPLDNWSPASVLETPPNHGEFAYRWISEFVNGVGSPQHVQSALREGYQRVTISELPESFIVDEDRGDGYARVGGLILMRLPTRFARQRQAHYAKRSREAVSAVNALQGVAGKDAVYEDRGSRVLTGSDGIDAIRTMSKG